MKLCSACWRSIGDVLGSVTLSKRCRIEIIAIRKYAATMMVESIGKLTGKVVTAVSSVRVYNPSLPEGEQQSGATEVNGKKLWLIMVLQMPNR